MDFPALYAGIWDGLDLLGKSDELDASSMVVRALLVFLATLLFLRTAGRRSFGQGSAFDLCLMVLLGAILSRAVVGASAMLPTLCAGATIVLLHRLLAMLLIRWPGLDDLLSGRERILIRDGKEQPREMHAGLISRHDLKTALRKTGNGADLDQVVLAVLERNGEISVVRQSRHADPQ
ncbi:DUF421 domain-containing protein [Herbaspirillum sp. LeCh32-8]|uniref:DUF421 domain-containing protein n=1 Tax=Herbaspirillum sp. LeCh32-8 TaxID=2821356 RepID=UPI001AE56F91|nr:YetF domain-containing protein [Herbaspirillum sp. LeCh32-8]MBP0599852.1 DUF421 domain-containing protein [Herbaspirillum sp. LeCh32-8]